MKTYTIEICNCKRRGEELIELIEFERPRFSNRDYKYILLNSLFWEACQGGIESKLLRAVVRCNGEKVLTFVCNTETDGETINAVITAARPREIYRRIRTMNIAS